MQRFLPYSLILAMCFLSATLNAGNFPPVTTIPGPGVATSPGATIFYNSGTTYTPVHVDPQITVTDPGSPTLLQATALGGTAPYNFTTTAGALPPGMTLASNGQLSGTPGAAGTYTIHITATDHSTGTGFPFTSSQTYIFVVEPVPLTISANNQTKFYDAHPYNGGNGVTYSGFVNNEGPLVLTGTLSYVGTSQGATNTGSYTITPSGVSSTNNTISYQSGTLTINPMAPDANGILYVNAANTANAAIADGSSWVRAVTSLSGALATAQTNTAVRQIWVAGGVYKPSCRADNMSGSNATDRNNAFVLVKDVKIYGGFAGNETQLSQRDGMTHVTILSGDFNGDDASSGSGSTLSIAGNSEDAFHVVIAAGDAGMAVLDGFTITGGNANSNNTITVNGSTIYSSSGGGMINYSASPIIANCVFTGNSTIGNGGGMYIQNLAAPVISNCSYTGNNADFGGGGMYCNYASPIINNCQFTENVSANIGGGVFNFQATPCFSNTLFLNNHAPNTSGGAIWNNSSSPPITNCTFYGNAASGGNAGAIYNNNNSNPVIRNSILFGNQGMAIGNDGSSSATVAYSVVQGGAVYTGTGNTNADPLFTDAVHGNFQLQPGSSCINTGDPQTNNNGYPAQAGSSDLAGAPRIIGSAVDMGAFEVQSAMPTIAFNNLANQIYGSADIPITTAASNNPAEPITFTSGNTAVATVYQNTADNKWYAHIVGAGTVQISASQAANAPYSAASVTASLTVNPAGLIITANPQTKVYGSADPSLTYTVSGYVNGDNNSIFTGTPGRMSGENAGTYPIIQNTLSGGNNYLVTFTGNILTITRASQVINWTQDLAVGCNGTAPQQLSATTSSALPVTYTVADTNIASVSGSALTLLQPGSTIVTATQAGDANHLAADPVTNTLNYQLPSAIRQHWSDMLLFDNTGGNYVQWQWYKNGNPVSGATSPYYSETGPLNGTYYALATDKNGVQQQTCPLTLTGDGTITSGIKAYPNPCSTGASVTITCSYTDAALQGSRLLISDITGKIWQQVSTVHPVTTLSMPRSPGVYIISLVLSNGQKATVNMLVY